VAGDGQAAAFVGGGAEAEQQLAAGAVQRREPDRGDHGDVRMIDEVGYIPFDPEAANLFFQLISSRYERASLIVTPATSPSEPPPETVEAWI
jgi:hypothetical protein